MFVAILIQHYLHPCPQDPGIQPHHQHRGGPAAGAQVGGVVMAFQDTDTDTEAQTDTDTITDTDTDSNTDTEASTLQCRCCYQCQCLYTDGS